MPCSDEKDYWQILPRLQKRSRKIISEQSSGITSLPSGQQAGPQPPGRPTAPRATRRLARAATSAGELAGSDTPEAGLEVRIKKFKDGTRM